LVRRTIVAAPGSGHVPGAEALLVEHGEEMYEEIMKQGFIPHVVGDLHQQRQQRCAALLVATLINLAEMRFAGIGCKKCLCHPKTVQQIMAQAQVRFASHNPSDQHASANQRSPRHGNSRVVPGDCFQPRLEDFIRHALQLQFG